MKINYDNKVKKKLADTSAIKRNYGKLADKIIMRLSLMMGANVLGDIPDIPPTRRHKLIGNYSGCWGIEIEKNWRIVVAPASSSVVDPNTIEEITIIDIVDYH